MSFSVSTKLQIIICLVFVFSLKISAQKEVEKFGNVSLEELKMRVYDKDTLAEAVVLFDKGESEIKYVEEKGFVLIYKRHTRIKILKKEGLEQANFEIPLYARRKNVDEGISKLKAQTYNLEDGKIVISKLSKDDVFKEDVSKYLIVQKFALPSVKVGSVIEVAYTIKSEFFYIRPWYFQSTIPVQYSEYTVKIPEYFGFKWYYKKYPSLIETKLKPKSAKLPVGEVYFINVNKFTFTDAEAFRGEDYITTIKDYIAKIEFEFLWVKYPGEALKSYTGTWEEINNTLLERSDFGKGLDNYKLFEEENIFLPGAPPTEQLNACYNFIRGKVKWNGYNEMYAATTIKDAYRKAEGNTAEINLLLVNLLRSKGFDAYPVLLSTRSNGKINTLYPKINSFDCVIALAKLNGKNILLDASHAFLKAGELPYEYLNGQGLIVQKDSAGWIDLKNDEGFKENTTILMKVKKSEVCADVRKQYLGLSARRKRIEIAQEGKEKYIEDFKNSTDWEINDFLISNEDDIQKPLIEKFTGCNEFDNESQLVYFSPVIFYKYIENPFKGETRNYPVDFGAPVNSRFIMNFILPEGFGVDELPESVTYTMAEQAARFSYRCIAQNGMIQIMFFIKINKSIFQPEEYKSLREFYMHITEKLNEQIVLKKI